MKKLVTIAIAALAGHLLAGTYTWTGNANDYADFQRRNNKMKKLLILTCAAASMLAPLLSSADTYQYIISGDPVAAATENSNSAVSGGKALVTDALTAVSATRSLEARFRTWCASIGRALRSDDWVTGLKIILR